MPRSTEATLELGPRRRIVGEAGAVTLGRTVSVAGKASIGAGVEVTPAVAMMLGMCSIQFSSQ